jgi:HD-like signal output (HDOD) protein
MHLEKLFLQPRALPAIPRVIQELIASFQDEGVAVKHLADLISTDQVITANLLRMANSAYFEVPCTIATVSDAVTRLGLTNVRTLVISLGLTGSFQSIPGSDAGPFWRYSLHTAVVARHLGKQIGIEPELAFTVGLMHAVGELVMHVAMPVAMRAMNHAVALLDPSRLDVEQTTFGYTHAEVGAELARRWNFPPLFAQAIAGAANPLVQDHFSPLAALVHIAAWRARAEANQLSPQDLETQWPLELAARIALSRETMLNDLPPLADLCEGLESLLS